MLNNKVTMPKYRVWLRETEPLVVEIEATSNVDARRKARRMLNNATLFEEVPVEITEGCLEVSNVERI